jgi:hypothetical protein
MARLGTTLLNLGTWTDNENPGAGSQTVDNTGLNGDKIKLDLAVGTEHNADGTHKADKIDGPNLKTTVADGSSLEATGTPRKLQVKALGIKKGHINSDVADGTTIEKDVTSGVLQIKAGGVGAGKILGAGTGKAVDGTTIGLNASNELEIKDVGVTGPKISHDNTRSKIVLVFGINPASGVGMVDDITTSPSIGIPVRLAGCVTGVVAISTGASITSAALAYNAAGAYHFAANSKLTVSNPQGYVRVWINGATVYDMAVGEAPSIVSLDIEFD